MKDFSIFTLGCKVNQVESASIGEVLAQNGFTVTLDLASAANYILNTCSVTHEADKKSRQALTRALKLNPAANIFVVGCSSQFDPQVFRGNPNVRMVAGTAGKGSAVDTILEYVRTPNDAQCVCIEPIPIAYEPLIKPLKSRTRALLKVQDGCDNYCSYCIVPYLRGPSRSRPLDDIIKEALALAQESQEITLTGICLSNYRVDGKPALAKLVHAFADVSVPRKRLGSLHPDSITSDFLDAMVESGFCHHIHLSVQSGSDTVLKRMNRPYAAQSVLEKIALIRSRMPDCGITSDIIAGFSGETEKEFNETAEFLYAAKFSDTHIFAYSEREGTAAAKWKQVEKHVRIARAASLKKIAAETRSAFLFSQIGRQADVLFEKGGSGYTANYIKVYADAAQGTVANVSLVQKYKDGISGKII